MTASPETAGLTITGLGVTTPQTDDPADLLGPPARAAGPGEDWFDLRSQLPGRGYKYLPPACHYALAAARRALGDSGAGVTGPDERAAGIALGTNHAATALHDEMDRTVIERGADELSPALAPFFSINLFASRLSMEHRFKAFNLTLNSPRIAGLEALETGSRALKLGRARVLLAGATEAPPPGRAGAEAGAAMLVARLGQADVSSGRPAYGNVTVRTLFVPPGSLATGRGRQAAAGSVTRVAEELLAPHPQPAAWHTFTAGAAVDEAVAAAGERIGGPVTIAAAGTGCLAPVLRVCGLLAGATDGVHLVTSASAEGTVGLALVSCLGAGSRAGRRN